MAARALPLLGALVLTLPAAVADVPAPVAEAHPSCAPYDGAAFYIQVQPLGDKVLTLMANVRLGRDAVGRWRMSGLTRPGGSTATLCLLQAPPAAAPGASAAPRCQNADMGGGGSFTVRAIAGHALIGHYDVHFGDGTRLQGEFTAAMKAGRGLPCG
jgi:hypothetical protein